MQQLGQQASAPHASPSDIGVSRNLLLHFSFPQVPANGGWPALTRLIALAISMARWMLSTEINRFSNWSTCNQKYRISPRLFRRKQVRKRLFRFWVRRGHLECGDLSPLSAALRPLKADKGRKAAMNRRTPKPQRSMQFALMTGSKSGSKSANSRFSAPLRAGSASQTAQFNVD